MLKKFGVIATTANALRLEAKTQISWTLNSTPWTDDSSFVEAQIAKGTKFED